MFLHIFNFVQLRAARPATSSGRASIRIDVRKHAIRSGSIQGPQGASTGMVSNVAYSLHVNQSSHVACPKCATWLSDWIGPPCERRNGRFGRADRCCPGHLCRDERGQRPKMLPGPALKSDIKWPVRCQFSFLEPNPKISKRTENSMSPLDLWQNLGGSHHYYHETLWLFHTSLWIEA